MRALCGFSSVLNCMTAKPTASLPAAARLAVLAILLPLQRLESLAALRRLPHPRQRVVLIARVRQRAAAAGRRQRGGERRETWGGRARCAAVAGAATRPKQRPSRHSAADRGDGSCGEERGRRLRWKRRASAAGTKQRRRGPGAKAPTRFGQRRRRLSCEHRRAAGDLPQRAQLVVSIAVGLRAWRARTGPSVRAPSTQRPAAGGRRASSRARSVTQRADRARSCIMHHAS